MDDTVFLCNNHIMTAMNAGYGAVYLTPNAMMDWSGGESVLQWRMSTKRTSSRDWIDVTIQPFATNMQIDYDDVHKPKDAVHLNMIGGGYPGGIFVPYIARNFNENPAPSDTFTSWADVLQQHGLTTSATRRDLFELHISNTHIKYGMPEYNFWPINTDIAALGWTQGVVQLNHYSYNPDKACNFDGSCGPNTWHWSDVSISPAVPFTINRADRRWVGPNTSNQLNFSQPAPANAKLRFYALGQPITVSYNGGQTWVSPTVPFPGGKVELPDNFWTDIPAGTTSVQFRGTQWYGGDWLVRDVAVWAPGAQAGPATAPTNTPTATATPVKTATPVPGATATPTGAQNQTIDFNNAQNPNRPLNGQYPSGVADWGTGKWYLSGPWQQFTNNSVSFSGASVTSASVGFPTPQRLVSLRAYNGGSSPTTVSLGCAGKLTVQVSIPANTVTTIQTNWTGTCTSVTVSSSNAWDTNFDTIVLSSK